MFEKSASTSDDVLKNPIAIEIFNDPEKYSILASPEFIHTMGLYYSESFEGGVGAKHGFWANNLCPALGADGKRLIDENGQEKWEHHGLDNLDKTKGLVMRMSDYESHSAHIHEAGKNNPLNLNQIEGREDISADLKEALCAAASQVYAMTSKDSVITSVQGANPHSFFRTTEIFAIMNNPLVKDIEILTEDMSKVGKDGHGPVQSSPPIPKKEAYQMLRDEWLESSITKYKNATTAYENYKRGTKNHTDEKEKAYNEALSSARSNLATEYVIAKRMSQETHPFTKNGLYKENAEIAYSAEDRAKEQERLKKIEKLQGIGKEFDESSEVENIFNKQVSKAMSTIDKIIYTARELGDALDPEIKRDFTRLATNFITNPTTKKIAKIASLQKEEEFQDAVRAFSEASAIKVEPKSASVSSCSSSMPGVVKGV